MYYIFIYILQPMQRSWPLLLPQWVLNQIVTRRTLWVRLTTCWEITTIALVTSLVLVTTTLPDHIIGAGTWRSSFPFLDWIYVRSDYNEWHEFISGLFFNNCRIISKWLSCLTFQSGFSLLFIQWRILHVISNTISHPYFVQKQDCNYFVLSIVSDALNH